MAREGYIPIKEVVALARQGYNDSEIVKKLKEDGYTPRQINDAFNQVKMKAAAGNLDEMEPSIMTKPEPEEYAGEGEGEEGVAPPTPSNEQGYGGYEGAEAPEAAATSGEEAYNYPQQVQMPAFESGPSTELIEEIAEEIINEKWQDFKTKAGDFATLRKFFEEKIDSLSARMKKVENSIDKIQNALVTRVRNYETELKNVGAEVHALETAFSKILEPLVSNVRKVERGEIEKETTRLKKREEDEDKLESKLIGKKKR